MEIVQLIGILLAAILPIITGNLNCYQCSDLQIETNLPSPQYDFINDFRNTLRNSRCFRRTPDYVESDSNNDPNTGQSGSQNKLYTKTCPSPVLGSSQVVRCGIWDGYVYAMIFDKSVKMKAFSFGCITLKKASELEIGRCYDRSDELADKRQFDLELQAYFKNNVRVTNFIGNLCIAKNDEDQLTSSANHVTAMGVLGVLGIISVGLFL